MSAGSGRVVCWRVLGVLACFWRVGVLTGKAGWSLCWLGKLVGLCNLCGAGMAGRAVWAGCDAQLASESVCGLR